MSDPTGPQFEDYWRKRISAEILAYDEYTHQCFGHGCPRCDISSALRTLAKNVARPSA